MQTAASSIKGFSDVGTWNCYHLQKSVLSPVKLKEKEFKDNDKLKKVGDYRNWAPKVDSKCF